MTPRAHRQSPQTGCGLPMQSSSLVSARSHPPHQYRGEIEAPHAVAKGRVAGFAQIAAMVSTGRRARLPANHPLLAALHEARVRVK